MQTYQKILLGILVSAIILIGSIQIYLSFFLDQQLKERFIRDFSQAADHSYNLKIDDLDLQIFGRQLSISGIKLTKKENNKPTDLHLTLDECNISEINLVDLLFRNALKTREVRFVNPNVFLATDSPNSSNKKIQWHKFSQPLYKTVLKVLDHVIISELTIQSLSINYNRTDLPVEPYFSIPNSDITLSNISIDSTSLTSNRLIPAENIELNTQNIWGQSPRGLYDISIAKIQFSSSDSMFIAKNFSVTPKFEKVAFSKKVGHEIDRINLVIQEIKGMKIDADRINSAQDFTAGIINIKKADLDIYRDKRAPESVKTYKPLPQEMIKHIPFPVTVDSILVTESNIRYSERVANAEKAGYLEFANLSAQLFDLSNIEARYKTNPPILHAETNVMNEGRLNVLFTFFMADKENRQHIEGKLKSMRMQPFNHILEPLAFVRIDKGQILGLDFDMNLSEKQAGGTLTFQYEDLKISLLNEEGAKETLGHKAKSLLANTFKINSDNKGKRPSVSKVGFERDRDKSVFNYWWKSLLSGLKESIGI